MPDDLTEDGRRIFKLPSILNADGVPTCPDCGCQDFRVTNSLHWEAGQKRRYRVCRHCGYKIRTREVLDS